MYNTDLPTRAELPSSRQLVRSTVLAAIAAAALLTTTVLPAEYGIDPTGIGSVLGLTEMGEIKTSLAAEAAAADARLAAAPAADAEPMLPPPVADAVAPASPAPAPGGDPASVAAARAPAEVVPAEPATPVPATPAAQTHEMTVTLKPGQAAEIKLDMRKGAEVAFEWTTRGGPVNYDTHGDTPTAPKDFYHGYGKGLQVTGDKGVLQAAFDGKHGWFWRNRSKANVSVTLNTRGEYTAIKRVL
ncbi:MAG: transmembrane anchor protein [Methylibium sp.]|uniref:transmembrane anchor protein n=1 Tax=Methylibium sp. TaxID=2067992 RepID=UPI0017A0F0BC|nr:transmembrane anchor protein [Methylibium sp.]MBA2721578.1 transmembrane anchor protein [Methylibium sp.]MBA3591218.1 transmembrane anchor protein [Methylibium sp.]